MLALVSALGLVPVLVNGPAMGPALAVLSPVPSSAVALASEEQHFLVVAGAGQCQGRCWKLRRLAAVVVPPSVADLGGADPVEEGKIKEWGMPMKTRN